MPLINPGDNPTWQEIQDGIVANSAERAVIEGLIEGAEADIKAAEMVIRSQKGELRKVTNNLRRWLAAIAKKAGDDSRR
jgi:hypothetical protein